MNAVESARRRRRLIFGTLVASLLVNGFLVGQYVHAHFFAEEQRRGGVISLEWRNLRERLPDEYREQMREALREDIPDFRPMWRRLRELRREIDTIAASAEPDRVEIDERLDEIRQITATMQERVQNRIYDTVLTFPADIRAELEPGEEDDDEWQRRR